MNMVQRTIKLTTCPMCGSANIKYVIEDRVYKVKNDIVRIPNVPRNKCFSCGEQFFGPESYEVINSFSIKKKTAVG